MGVVEAHPFVYYWAPGERAEWDTDAAREQFEKWAYRQYDLIHKALIVLALAANAANEDWALTMISQETIGKAIRRDVRSVRRLLHRLEDAGELEVDVCHDDKCAWRHHYSRHIWLPRPAASAPWEPDPKTQGRGRPHRRSVPAITGGYPPTRGRTWRKTMPSEESEAGQS